ncbi:hypothetical protein ACFQY7_33940 [Actinomadura luteofluorescens]|uniref:hypothetical protein n=1 Tax=Actinomadura luteofluorescens TaxID=46163 RepID=UPI003627824A
MRELLARAAQDHVYEQRSQGQVLDEIRQRLEGMEWLLREVRERELTGLTGQIESVRGQVDDLSGKPLNGPRAWPSTSRRSASGSSPSPNCRRCGPTSAWWPRTSTRA